MKWVPRISRWLVAYVVMALGVVGPYGAAQDGAPAAPSAAPATDAPPPQPWRGPIVLGAHRGGAGLFPENTLVAFRSTAEAWPDMLIETDARLSSDGQVVLIHDERVDRTTDGGGLVAEKSAADLRTLDAGSRFTPDGGVTYPYRGKGVIIPTLAETLTALPNARFMIELKDVPGIADAVIKVVSEARAENRVLLASFQPGPMVRVRELAPTIATTYDLATGAQLLIQLRSGQWDAYKPVASVLSVDVENLDNVKLTADEITKIKSKGILFQVHTINTKDQMLDMFKLGVDGMLSDVPNVLVEAYNEYVRSPK